MYHTCNTHLVNVLMYIPKYQNVDVGCVYQDGNVYNTMTWYRISQRCIGVSVAPAIYK